MPALSMYRLCAVCETGPPRGGGGAWVEQPEGCQDLLQESTQPAGELGKLSLATWSLGSVAQRTTEPGRAQNEGQQPARELGCVGVSDSSLASRCEHGGKVGAVGFLSRASRSAPSEHLPSTRLVGTGAHHEAPLELEP